MTPRRHRLLSLLVLGLAGCSKPKPPAFPPATVVVAPVERRDVPVVLEATGTVEPLQSAAVAPQVDGIVRQVLFREGDDVAGGQPLFQIDDHRYASQLAQAQAELARDQAQLESALRDRQRFEELAGKEFVTAQQLDQARTAAEAMTATVRSDSSALLRARIDLDRTTVRAPIAGRTGALLVREGNLVRAAAGEPMVTINQLSPILVRFPVPATQLAGVRLAGAGLAVQASPVGDTAAALPGKLVFFDNAVDSLTGTILLKASFPNGNRTLWPGALVRVRLTVQVEKDALVVPVAAVLSGQQGTSVFVLGDSGTVQLRRVTVLRSTDRDAVLKDGVKPGERVVTEGQVRLTDGARATAQAADSTK